MIKRCTSGPSTGVITDTVPTFFLPRISPTSLKSRYASGEFSNTTLEMIKIECMITMKVESKLVDQPYYHIIKTNNCKDTVTFVLGDDESMLKFCGYCRMRIEHIARLPTNIDISNDIDENGDIYQKISISGTGRYCCLECLYAASKLVPRDRQYRDLDRNLQFLSKYLYPGEIIRPSKDFGLLNINDGPLTIEEYRGRNEYHQIGVVMNPVKLTFRKTIK
jgi:hypothetical protein